MNDAMRVGGAAQQRHDASMAAQQQTAANQYNIYASRDERRVFSESVLVSRIKELEKWCREQVVACEAYAGILNAIDEDLIPRFRDDPDGIPIWENRAETLARARRLVLADENPGDHPYHGPVEGGKTIPDEVHQRMHRSIGDVLAGKVLPEARRQMQEALKGVPKEKVPFPLNKVGVDPRRMGLAMGLLALLSLASCSSYADRVAATCYKLGNYPGCEHDQMMSDQMDRAMWAGVALGGLSAANGW